MKTPDLEKTALFIDGPNLYGTAKTLGFDIDYKLSMTAHSLDFTPKSQAPAVMMHVGMRA